MDRAVGDLGASFEPPRFSKDELAVTILHVSDMQFGRNHRFAEGDGGLETLLQRLCDDLHLLKQEHELDPDLVALTGDLAEWGRKREFEQVAMFGEGLLKHLGLPPDRLLIVPGNHDINRKLCEAYFAQCEGQDENPQPPYWPKWGPMSSCSIVSIARSRIIASRGSSRGRCSKFRRSASS